MNPIRIAVLSLVVSVASAIADGPTDNIPDKVRPVPPPGIRISDADRTELTAAVDQLGNEIETLRSELKSKPVLLGLLPDAQIFHKAVHWALIYDEFFKSNEVAVARTLLKQGTERVQSLREGKSPWTTATGLVARGFISRIDGSVQPYGLVVPASYQPAAAHRHRLDFWFHGRGETLTELDFINGRLKSPGEFTPPNAFVLHSYGRYCNGNKFAGETDVFEMLEHVRKHYPIDENRLVVRGFSLGALRAGTWRSITPDCGRPQRLARAFQKHRTF